MFGGKTLGKILDSLRQYLQIDLAQNMGNNIIYVYGPSMPSQQFMGTHTPQHGLYTLNASQRLDHQIIQMLSCALPICFSNNMAVLFSSSPCMPFILMLFVLEVCYDLRDINC